MATHLCFSDDYPDGSKPCDCTTGRDHRWDQVDQPDALLDEKIEDQLAEPNDRFTGMASSPVEELIDDDA